MLWKDTSSSAKSVTPEVVRDLASLVTARRKFPTIYSDPPWQDENSVGRAAAKRRYRMLTLAKTMHVPVRELADTNAHLHLWTTNRFLREAFDVIDAWGFCYESCFVWVKPQLGAGNYSRVSHEFLLLGVRGKLPCRDRCQRSWLQAVRTEHSRKPSIVRCLIETVSAGPYLELYGRAEIHDPKWTVYGNQVERRLF